MLISQDSKRGLTIRREPSDPRCYKDSTLFYRIAKELWHAHGFNVMRKDAGKDDGNLTSEGNYYVREKGRAWSYGWHFGDYQIRPAYQDFNGGGLYLMPLGDCPGLREITGHAVNFPAR